jgi:hypothetical protein
MARRSLPAWIVGLAIATAACSSPASPGSSTELPLTRLRTDSSSYMQFSGYETAMAVAIRDRAAWLSAWAQMYGRTNTLPPPLPEIDFANEMILLVALGTQPSSGYDVIIDRASESGDVVTVDATARRPGNCGVLTVITTPVDVARVPKRTGAVVFRTSPVTTTCR